MISIDVIVSNSVTLVSSEEKTLILIETVEILMSTNHLQHLNKNSNLCSISLRMIKMMLLGWKTSSTQQ
jgi:hypothetical protein